MFGAKFALAMAAALCAGALLAPAASAQYPEKNIEFIIPFGPGGGFDRTVRLVSPYLEKALGGKVEVLPKNVAGAGGRKGLATVFRAKPDGYLLVIANVPGAALPEVMGEQVEYELTKFTWIARLATEEYMVAVPANSPIKSLDDMKKLGRPVKIPHTDYGSTAYAATAIFTAELNIPVQHLVGYKGTNDYIVATIRGDGDAAMAPVSTLRKFIEAGDMRGLVTMEAKSTIGNVPTIGSLGHDSLTGLAVDRYVLAPPGLPDAIRKTLSDAFAKAVQDPELKAAAEKSGEPFAFLPSDQAKASAERSLALYLKYKAVLGRKQ
ncbi:MAG TPA: tripartite tricarboxylate transporter substrate binding protein [Hyphomicrobiaceae bacterium]|nr:tripartite tricarboxylate transporter substrate binding protein [Hyphomicrobiaceae bacterium]